MIRLHPPPPLTPHLRRPLPALALFTAASLAAAVLFRFPPERYSFYPQCPVQLLFGLQCPGCGTTRAFAALLHGHLTDALRLNALTVCALPAGAAYLVLRRLPLLRKSSPWLLYTGLAATTLFTLARNL